MSNVVLDASALLAMLLDEPGGETVRGNLDGALLGVVNLAEVVSHLAKLGATRDMIEGILRPLPMRVVASDASLSYDAGMLRPVTLRGGLSLGDRYCLALARQHSIPVLTAERHWPKIAEAAGVVVQLIR